MDAVVHVGQVACCCSRDNQILPRGQPMCERSDVGAVTARSSHICACREVELVGVGPLEVRRNPVNRRRQMNRIVRIVSEREGDTRPVDSGRDSSSVRHWGTVWRTGERVVVGGGVPFIAAHAAVKDAARRGGSLSSPVGSHQSQPRRNVVHFMDTIRGRRRGLPAPTGRGTCDLLRIFDCTPARSGFAVEGVRGRCCNHSVAEIEGERGRTRKSSWKKSAPARSCPWR